MNVGDTFREKGATWVWAKCPECLEERAVRKRGPLVYRLCSVCAPLVARKVNDLLWKNVKYGDD